MEPDRVAVAFARVLRGAGLDVPVGSTIGFARALECVGLATASGVYWAGRATLVRRPDDIASYDRAFAVFWTNGGPADALDEPDERPGPVSVAFDVELPSSGDDTATVGIRPSVTVRWSPVETLRERDFACYTPGEFAQARRLMADLRVTSARRPSRRRKPTSRSHGSPDLRRTIRRSFGAGGEVVPPSFHEAGTRARPLVVLLDVSGSMEPYARAFVRFVHAAVVSRTRVEAFTLGTRLTRVTRQLQSRDPDAAVRAAAGRVADWAGGTRLGDGLRAFNDGWGVPGMARGATVVILSDGWDRGDPEALAEQMARLARVAYKIVWVNPLKASPGYAPLAQGMAAALPHVDAFVEGHSIAALEELAAVISR
ncbi:MAG: vWA domain-containing protein [Acidimicrobiia bacterium]